MNPATSPYRPGREIARGGMGAVLDARDQKLGRSVAMKVMLRRNAGEEEQQRFLQEARVLGQLAHPNIVPVHDVGTDEQGRLFYTMKLVQGVTLNDVIGKLKAGDKDTLAKYPLNALLTAFQKVCDAVAFAHSRGIIHRDLKPQNIMVGEFGEVLVMDWGLAKILPGSPAAEEAAKTPTLRGQLGQVGPTGTLPLNAPAAEEQATLASGEDQATVASGTGSASAPKLMFGSQDPEPAAPSGVYATLEGAVMGTPHFMSPEQAEGKIAELDGRSDIFSLGGILYSLLTLRPPVEGDSLEEILSKVRSGTIAPPTAFNVPSSTTQGTASATGAVTEPRKIHPLSHCPDGKVPSALSAVTMKALTRDKTRRYQTVAEFTRDIVAYQGGFATSAENANALTLVRLFIHRHKALTAAAALFVLLTIGFMAKVISSEKKATANAEQAEANAKTAREHEAQAKANAKTAEENAAKAKAAEAAAVEKSEAARQALAKSALNLAEAALREGDGAAMQAALGEVPEDLRDATWRYLIEQADTSIARIQTGAKVIEGAAAHPRRPGVFAVADSNKKVTLIDLRTGARLLEFTPEFPPKSNGDSYRLAFSPDGERIAVGRGSDGGIVIHSARDGRKLLGWTAPRTEELEFSADGRLLLQQTIPRQVLKVWDAASGQPAWEYVPSRISDYTHGAFTPDGQQVLTIGYGDDFRLVGARDGVLSRSFKSEGDVITALAVAGNGMAAADRQGFVQVLDLRAGRVRLRFRAHEGRIGFLAFTPAGDEIVTGVALPDGRQALHVWLAATGERRRVLLGGSGEIWDMGVHPLTGELLVCGPSARAWSLTGQPPVWNISGIAFPTRPVFWSSEEMLFATANGASGALQILQPGTPAILWKPANNFSPQADVSADGKLAVYAWGAKESGLTLLRHTGSQPEEARTLKLKDGPSSLRLSAGGERVVMIADRNRRAELLDTATGLPLPPLERGDVKRFWSFGWLGSGGQRLVGLVTAKAERGLPGSEEWLVLWDAATGKIVQRVTNRTAMDVLVTAPDGRRFAEAGADKMVRIRDAATLAVQQEFRAHDGPVTALAWHPVKPILATASADLTVRLWHLETGRRLEELRGPQTAPIGLGFSPSGQRLACASPNDATRIWEPPSLSDKPAAAKTNDGWEDLLAPLTPANVASTGNGWRLEGGTLFSPVKSYATLPLPGDLSGTSYTVRVKLRQLMAKNGFSLELPVGHRMVGFDLDGDGGKWTSLTLVNGKWGKDVPGALAGKQVKDSEQHDLEVTVSLADGSAVITTTLDGQRLYEWAGPTTALSQTPYWKTPPGVLALGTAAADWVVYEVKVKRLGGKP